MSGAYGWCKPKARKSVLSLKRLNRSVPYYQKAGQQKPHRDFRGVDVAHGILYKGRPPVACRLSDTKTERLLCLMSVFLYACQSSPLAPVQISHLSFSSDG